MTDQDWEVDGATSGSAAGSGEPATGAAGQTGDDAGAVRSASDQSAPRPANVVPFPGSWFGSVEDLVPIHPEPRSSVMELGQETAEPSRIERGEPRREDIEAPEWDALDVAAADASDFWEGDAGALEEVAVPAQPQSAIALLRSPGASKRKERPGPSSGAAATDSAGAPARSVRQARTTVAALLALAAASACALLVEGVFAGRTDRGARRHEVRHGAVIPRPATPAVTQTLTTAVTVTRTIRTRPRHHTGVQPGAAHGPQRSTTPAVHHSASVSGVTSAPALTTPEPSSSSNSESTSSSQGSTTSGQSSANSNYSSAKSSQGSVSSVKTNSASSGSGCAALSPDSGCRP